LQNEAHVATAASAVPRSEASDGVYLHWCRRRLQGRTADRQRCLIPLLQSVASRKPTSVMPIATRRNSIVLIAGIKRNLYLSYQPSAISFQPNQVVGFRK